MPPLDDAADLQELPTDPSVVRRDRLLGALFAVDPETSLLQHRPEFSLLVSPNAPPQIFLLPTRDRDARDRLPRVIAEIVRVASTGSVPTHVVAIGGGPMVVDVLSTAARGGASVRFGFHHVDDASRLTHVTGDKLPLLETAAERIKLSEAPSSETLREALTRGRSLVERDQQALEKLHARTPVTFVLIAACAAVALFAYAKVGSSAYTKVIAAIDATHPLFNFFVKEPKPSAYEKLVAVIGATNGLLVRGGAVWRLFASMFHHWSPMHFLMNMLALYNLGQLLEPILGPRRFFILYGLSGLGGALVTTYFGHSVSAGASGAIWGLMTAVLAIVVFPRGLLPPLLLARLKASAWRPLVLNIFLSFLPGIDLRAHFGGGFFGFVLMILFLGDGLVPMDARLPGASIETEPRQWLTGIALILGIVMAGSIGMGMLAVRG